MIYSYLMIPAEGFLLAIAIDILFGEPRAFINIRDTSQKISSWFLHKFVGKKGKIGTGFLIVLATSIIIITPIIILLDFINYGIYRDTLLVFIYAVIHSSPRSPRVRVLDLATALRVPFLCSFQIKQFI